MPEIPQNWIDAGEQFSIPCAIVRGGSSKAVVLRDEDLPSSRNHRDALILQIMGSPDSMQIDGLGGANVLTSKLAIIGRPTVENADVDYLFAQVDINQREVDYGGNCGNISSAIAPFALDQGIVSIHSDPAVVRIHNVNTGKILVATVPLSSGKAAVTGDFQIAGVPSSGAKIIMDYRLTGGSVTGEILPTGKIRDDLKLGDGSIVSSTLVDFANPIIFVAAKKMGLSGSELPETIEANRDSLIRIDLIRRHAAVRLGFAESVENADQQSPLVPMVVIVAPPSEYTTRQGSTIAADSFDLHARFYFMNRIHTAMSGTGAICMAAASMMRGSVVADACSGPNFACNNFKVGHPAGIMEIGIEASPDNTICGVQFHKLSFGRTARILMNGTAFFPKNTFTGKKNTE